MEQIAADWLERNHADLELQQHFADQRLELY